MECSNECSKTQQVVVEKAVYFKGIVRVRGPSDIEAKDKIMADIRAGRLKPYTVAWGCPKDHDGSFQTTGDVL